MAEARALRADSVSEDDLLIFAVPKKGRLFTKCDAMLRGAGLDYTRANRLDIALCNNFPVRLVFLPAKDIAQFVAEGNVDLGITGQDMVAECGVVVDEIMPLGFGKCRLCVQAPVANGVTDVSSLVGKRICTSFPRLAKGFFDALDASSSTKIKVIGGSVEAACGLGLADAVVDLVETGTTMKAAGLEVVADVIATQAVLIANPHSKKKRSVEIIRKRFEGYLAAQRYTMVYYNIEKAKLSAASAITPGKRAPSVTDLSPAPGSVGGHGDTPVPWVALSAMVLKAEVNNIMDELTAIGAQDIFVIALANCRTG